MALSKDPWGKASKNWELSAQLSLAIGIANWVHEDHLDKQGKPYILHPLRVMLAGTNYDEMIVGVLHDIFEDSLYSIDEMANEYPKLITPKRKEALVAVTRMKGEIYTDYIKRVCLNELATTVKINDLEDNLGRMSSLRKSDRVSLEKRYRKALEIIDENLKPKEN